MGRLVCQKSAPAGRELHWERICRKYTHRCWATHGNSPDQQASSRHICPISTRSRDNDYLLLRASFAFAFSEAGMRMPDRPREMRHPEPEQPHEFHPPEIEINQICLCTFPSVPGEPFW